MRQALVALLLLVSGCGKTGPQGGPGPQGYTGPPGSSCAVTTISPSLVAPNGGSLLSCTDGSSSLVLNGTNGENGTSIIAVQFCAGATNYPNEFNEVGFCIDGSIYAVYSANDGFLTEVVPGEYSSQGIGSSCNFSVEPGCVIFRD
jgi:hypothetical protein